MQEQSLLKDQRFLKMCLSIDKGLKIRFSLLKLGVQKDFPNVFTRHP